MSRDPERFIEWKWRMNDPDAWRGTYDTWKTTEPERFDEELEEYDEPEEAPNECLGCGRDISMKDDYCFDCHRKGYG